MSEDKNKEAKPEGQNPNPTGEQKERKLKVEISRDPEVDQLQEELSKIKAESDAKDVKITELSERSEAEKLELTDKVTQYEAEKAQLALEQFEKDKKDIVDLCKSSGSLTEEQIKEIEDRLKTPQQLESIKAMVNMMISAIPKKEEKPEKEDKAPAGKAPLSPPEAPPNPDVTKDGVKMVDEIYAVLNDQSGKYSPQQKKEAQDKRLMLWNSLIHGKSWEQLRRGTSIGTAVTMACPQCGATIHGQKVPERCENCGFDFTKTGDRHQMGKA